MFFRYDFAIGGDDRLRDALRHRLGDRAARVRETRAGRSAFAASRCATSGSRSASRSRRFVVSAALEPLLHAGEEQGLAPDEWITEPLARIRPERRSSSYSSRRSSEEVFYRGLGVRVLGFLGRFVAIGGTALVFALAHGILVAVPAARGLRRRPRLAALAHRERVARSDRARAPTTSSASSGRCSFCSIEGFVRTGSVHTMQACGGVLSSSSVALAFAGGAERGDGHAHGRDRPRSRYGNQATFTGAVSPASRGVPVQIDSTVSGRLGRLDDHAARRDVPRPLAVCRGGRPPRSPS